jgi:hypothetical protein
MTVLQLWYINVQGKGTTSKKVHKKAQKKTNKRTLDIAKGHAQKITKITKQCWKNHLIRVIGRSAELLKKLTPNSSKTGQ